MTAFAAAIRFYGIGHQGLWFDEAYTVMLVKLPLGRMLATIPKTESTPYVYYVAAWIWTRAFGHGAVAIRSLSALFGVALVPVAYLAAERLLASRRAGLVVAALTACNPLLIWYSQEARAYELLALTSALSLLAFAHARERPDRRTLAAWALASALALASHYEAALLVVPEALWLAVVHRRRLVTWVALAFVAACGGALLPLLIKQTSEHNAAWIRKAPLGARLGQILPQFLLGTGSYAYTALALCGLAVCLVALALLARYGQRTQRRALVPAALALAGFALVMAIDAAGTDTVITRNLLALWLPLAVALGACLSLPRAGRAGLLLAGTLCAIGLAAAVSVAADPTLQRPDWPAVVRALGPWPSARQPAGATRLVIFQRNVWLESLTAVYMPNTRDLRRGKPRRVTEIEIVANSAPPGSGEHWLCWWGAGCNLEPSRLARHYDIPGFRAVSRTHVRQFTILRLVSARPRRVYQGQILRALRRAGSPLYGVLIQRP
jgi:4-amino-4-deoxy-L-arabinose transferase-like glycosyltransferase